MCTSTVRAVYSFSTVVHTVWSAVYNVRNGALLFKTENGCILEQLYFVIDDENFYVFAEIDSE